MSLQFPRTVVMLKFNNVLHRPMVSLYLTLGLRMKWFASNMSNGLFSQKLFQITRDVTGAVYNEGLERHHQTEHFATTLLSC